jgi:hypothetical protein
MGGIMSDVEDAQPMASTQRMSATLVASAVAVGTLRENVESGKLKLDPSAGEEILSMLAEQRDQVDLWLRRAHDLARRAPLGQNPVGEAMADKFVHRASSEGASFSGVLTHYRQVLEDAHDAVGDAMGQYRDLEESTAEAFRKLGR